MKETLFPFSLQCSRLNKECQQVYFCFEGREKLPSLPSSRKSAFLELQKWRNVFLKIRAKSQFGESSFFPKLVFAILTFANSTAYQTIRYRIQNNVDIMPHCKLGCGLQIHELENKINFDESASYCTELGYSLTSVLYVHMYVDCYFCISFIFMSYRGFLTRCVGRGIM
jgi:hypothetical protein